MATSTTVNSEAETEIALEVAEVVEVPGVGEVVVVPLFVEVGVGDNGGDLIAMVLGDDPLYRATGEILVPPLAVLENVHTRVAAVFPAPEGTTISPAVVASTNRQLRLLA